MGGEHVEIKKPKQSARLSSEVQKSDYLHTEEHVVQSTFQNMLITF